MTEYNFDDIRPFADSEVPEALTALLADPEFLKFRSKLFPKMSDEEFAAMCRPFRSRNAFKWNVGYEIVSQVAAQSAFSLDISGRSRLGEDLPFTYISNHRDIILDAAFLNVCLRNIDRSMCQIAIGDNLLKRPWIRTLVKLLGSFIVKRSPSVREMIYESNKLSAYIHSCICEQRESVWIAQREGRAKDADDRTQTALLKMLAMSGDGSLLDRFRALNIVPVSFSYEYDPCDFLKARELQAKRDNPDYSKSPTEDLLNMSTGLTGYKGRVHITLGEPLNHSLDRVNASASNKDQLCEIALLIDLEIHRRYRLYPGNYVALDLLEESSVYSKHYSEAEKQKFVNYILGQVEKIVFEDGHKKDEPFLYQAMLKMYANPAKNYLAASTSVD
ncbi:MAG: 1-acyl-sn-glycerol-3-phosphate acyltransferase [Porphyromonas sp.]|nr:1-acyl-sn-glycerol-3-phosphate acyltransferase [Porphyromonas sp.]